MIVEKNPPAERQDKIIYQISEAMKAISDKHNIHLFMFAARKTGEHTTDDGTQGDLMDVNVLVNNMTAISAHTLGEQMASIDPGFMEEFMRGLCEAKIKQQLAGNNDGSIKIVPLGDLGDLIKPNDKPKTTVH